MRYKGSTGANVGAEVDGVGAFVMTLGVGALVVALGVGARVLTIPDGVGARVSGFHGAGTSSPLESSSKPMPASSPK